MPIKSADFPPIQPYRFLPVGEVLPSNYHTPQFDRDFFKNQLKDFQKRNKFGSKYGNFYQLLQSDGIVTVIMNIPIASLGSGSYTMSFLSCKGVKTTITGKDQYVDRSGNYYDAHGSIDALPLRYVQWKFKVSDIISTNTGAYYLLIDIVYADTSKGQFISEPINIQKDLKNTLLFQINNSINDYDIYFDLIPEFEFRIDAFYKYQKPVFDITSFRNQKKNLRQLYAAMYRLFTLTIGNQDNVAPYIIDKLARMMCCDMISIDGIAFLLEQNPDFTITEYGPNYPLVSCTIPIVEYSPEDAGNFLVGTGSSFRIYKLIGSGTDYPYAAEKMTIGKVVAGHITTGYSIIGGVIKEFFSQSDETSFITYLNTTVVTLYSQTGIYSIDSDGYLIYTNGSGENWVADTAIIYQPAFIVSNTGTAIPLEFDASIYGTGTTKTILSDYTSGPTLYKAPQVYTSGGGVSTVSYLSTAVNHKTYIYTDNTMTAFYMNTTGSSHCTGLSGKLSSVFSILFLKDANFSFDLAIFNNCKDTISQIIIQNTTFTGFDTSIWGAYSGLSTNWTQLNYVDLINNNLSSADVDAFYNTFWNMNRFKPAIIGTLRTQGSTGAPTSTSLTARNNLIAKGWTLYI